MPTVDQYAAAVIEKHRVITDNGSASHHAADAVIPLLKQWGKQYLLGISLSGAYAKNTAVAVSTHVDLLIALKPVPNMEMKAVFWNLFEFLTDHGLRPHTKTVSMQVESKGMKVDLIPACREKGSSRSLLFNRRADAPVETDVAQHIHLIANSGRQQEICALKVWRERHSLDFPSLYLELTVLHALQGERFGQLGDNMLAILRFLGTRFEEETVSDPANGKNILSEDLSPSAKEAVSKTARDALYDENWKKIIW